MITREIHANLFLIQQNLFESMIIQNCAFKTKIEIASDIWSRLFKKV